MHSQWIAIERIGLITTKTNVAVMMISVTLAANKPEQMPSDGRAIDDLFRTRQHHGIDHQGAGDRIEILVGGVVVHGVVLLLLRGDILDNDGISE